MSPKNRVHKDRLELIAGSWATKTTLKKGRSHEKHISSYRTSHGMGCFWPKANEIPYVLRGGRHFMDLPREILEGFLGGRLEDPFKIKQQFFL